MIQKLIMEQSLYLKNDLNTDYKAIVKAAELIESGEYQSDQIAVLPVGDKKRAFSKEISGHQLYYSESKRTECLTLEINREGLYDMLPEGLFHQPPTGSASMSEEDMVEDVKLRRAEEKDARRFFMPFEAELNHMKILLELYENRLDKKTTYADLTQIFASEWTEFRLFNREQSIIWMNFLPLIHQKRNDVKFLGQLLSLLFNVNVEVSYNSFPFRKVPIEEPMQFRLGSGTLGINSIIGDSFIAEEEELDISIGPASTLRLLDFMPGTANDHIIALTVAYLMPVDVAVEISLIATEHERVAELGLDAANSYLGYTVYL